MQAKLDAQSKRCKPSRNSWESTPGAADPSGRRRRRAGEGDDQIRPGRRATRCQCRGHWPGRLVGELMGSSGSIPSARSPDARTRSMPSMAEYPPNPAGRAPQRRLPIPFVDRSTTGRYPADWTGISPTNRTSQNRVAVVRVLSSARCDGIGEILRT
jgi:hypothetical protein